MQSVCRNTHVRVNKNLQQNIRTNPNAAEFLARWKVRYIDAEGRILEELDTTVAECVEDANEEGFSREDLDQAAGGDLKAYIREAIAKAQGR
jgi:hypothetical protein